MTPLLTSQDGSVKQNRCSRIFGDTCLRKNAAILLTEVETLFGKKVVYRENTKYDAGNSTVESDGTPVIEVNPSIHSRNKLRQEAIVVHEFFHLKMKATGYPYLSFVNTELHQQNAAFFQEMNSMVFSAIEHIIFYPQMRKMGLNPSAEIEEYFRTLDRNNETTGPPNDYQRAVLFMRAKVEVSDRKLLGEIEKWYSARKWNKPLAKGNELAQIVLSVHPNKPDDEVEVFVKCMNALIGEIAKVSHTGWEKRQYGNMIFRLGIIRVDPA